MRAADLGASPPRNTGDGAEDGRAHGSQSRCRRGYRLTRGKEQPAHFTYASLGRLVSCEANLELKVTASCSAPTGVFPSFLTRERMAPELVLEKGRSCHALAQKPHVAPAAGQNRPW